MRPRVAAEPGDKQDKTTSFTYDYDANGSLIKVTEPDASATSISYDEADHTSSIATPDGDTVGLAYEGPTQQERPKRPVPPWRRRPTTATS